MPMLKTITAHNSCQNIKRYLLKQGRGTGFVYNNIVDKAHWDREMDTTRRLYGHDKRSDSVSYRHFVYAPDPWDNATLESLQAAAPKWATENFETCQWVIVCHQDSGKLHAHIVVNSTVLDTGNKVQISNARVGELARSAQDIGREFGFSELPDLAEKQAARRLNAIRLTKTEETLLRHGKTSYKMEIRDAIDAAQLLAQDPRSFGNIMKYRYGISFWTNKDGGLTFKTDSGNMASTKTLGEAYSAVGIYARLGTNRYTHRSNFNLDSPRPRLVQTSFERHIRRQSRSSVLKRISEYEEMFLTMQRYGIADGKTFRRTLTDLRTQVADIAESIEHLRSSNQYILVASGHIERTGFRTESREWLAQHGIAPEDYPGIKDRVGELRREMSALDKTQTAVSSDLEKLENGYSNLYSLNRAVQRNSLPKAPSLSKAVVRKSSQQGRGFRQPAASAPPAGTKDRRHEVAHVTPSKDRQAKPIEVKPVQPQQEMSMRQRKAIQQDRDKNARRRSSGREGRSY